LGIAREPPSFAPCNVSQLPAFAPAEGKSGARVLRRPRIPSGLRRDFAELDMALFCRVRPRSFVRLIAIGQTLLIR